MSALRKFAGKIANEPIAHLAGTVQSMLVWLFTYVVTSWDPSTHQQELAGLATAGAYAIALIARQFVTPVAKTPAPAPVAAVEQPAVPAVPTVPVA